MPKNKDLKRLARERMAKTGESYTTARARLLAGRRHARGPSPNSEPAELVGRSTRGVERATGHDRASWLDGWESFRADAKLGWRRLSRSKVTTAVAVLSLSLGLGVCLSAFRLVDALLMRPLPVAGTERLYAVEFNSVDEDGTPVSYGQGAHPLYLRLRDVAAGQAKLLGVSEVERIDLTYGSDREMEWGYRQFVSGGLFAAFGLQPTLGRLFTEDDDLQPQSHPQAVLAHHYWDRRFGRDPDVTGRTLRIGDRIYEIIGVASEGFTGTEPGTMADLFVPTMMNPRVQRSDAGWLRTFALLEPGASLPALREKMQAVFHSFQQDRFGELTGVPQQLIAQWLSESIRLERAPAGVSNMQESYRTALAALGMLVALVLLIACANVANLMLVRAAARSRELALRISLGASRARLIQTGLIESLWISSMATVLGLAFSWWAVPLVVAKTHPVGNPAQLHLPMDFRAFGFAFLLTFGVTLLAGLLPALRTSVAHPARAAKEIADPRGVRRLAHASVVVQVAFSFLVLYVGGLFVATHDRLASQPTGFSAERLLVLYTVTSSPQPQAYWQQVGAHLETVPGVEAVALSDRALLDGRSWNNVVTVNGEPRPDALAFLRAVSPGWFDVMKIPLLDGRDFRPDDTRPAVAIVNEMFAKTYFDGENPVGRTFAERDHPVRIVGMVKDARYRRAREPILPVAYYPLPATDAEGAPRPRRSAAFVVRTSSAEPLALASTLRREVTTARSEFRVWETRTQLEINQSNVIRERLLALLATFFGAIGLLISAFGLYAVLGHAVLQRRREIGIRRAVGAQGHDIVRRIVGDIFVRVLVGALVGLALGLASVKSIAALLYDIQATDPAMLAFPALTLVATAVVAAWPRVVAALKIDPATTLRTES